MDDLVNTIYNKATEEGYGVTKDSIIKAINTNKLTNNGVQQILKDSGSKLFRDKLDQLLKASVDNPDGFDYGGKSIFDLVETDPSINAMLLVASPEVKEAFMLLKNNMLKDLQLKKQILLPYLIRFLVMLWKQLNHRLIEIYKVLMLIEKKLLLTFLPIG